MQTSAVKKRDHSVVDKYTISSRAIPACPRFSLHQIEYPYPPCCMSHFLSICTIASVQSAFRVSHQGIQPAVSYKQINLRNEKCRSPPRGIKTIQRTVQISKHPPSMRLLKWCHIRPACVILFLTSFAFQSPGARHSLAISKSVKRSSSSVFLHLRFILLQLPRCGPRRLTFATQLDLARNSSEMKQIMML